MAQKVVTGAKQSHGPPGKRTPRKRWLSPEGGAGLRAQPPFHLKLGPGLGKVSSWDVSRGSRPVAPQSEAD